MVEKNFVKEKEKEKEKNRTGVRSTPSGRKEQIKHDCLLYPSTGDENGLREVATVALEHGGGRRRDQARS